MFNKILTSISGLIIGISLASCGGGTDYAEGGIGGTGISNGSVTGYGSIIVNGVHFDTTGAEVTKDDGTPVTNVNDADIEDFIKLGMVVTVKGTINDGGVTGKAETISYDDLLEGPVVGTPSGTSITILGQNVNVIDDVTLYACSYTPCSLSPLNALTELTNNQIIEISGYIDYDGSITATYIELQEDTHTSGKIYELKGTATVTASSFNIGTLIINDDITTDTAALDGKFVKVKGTFDGSNTLTTTEATEVDDESFDIADADKAELEGLATTGCTSTTSCDFTLSGVTVRIDRNTTFIPDTATGITAGDKLEAEGKLQGGILYANEIEFKK